MQEISAGTVAGGKTGVTLTPYKAMNCLRAIANRMGWNEEHVLEVAVGLTTVAAAAWMDGQRIGVAFPHDDEVHLIVTQY